MRFRPRSETFMLRTGSWTARSAPTVGTSSPSVRMRSDSGTRIAASVTPQWSGRPPRRCTGNSTRTSLSTTARSPRGLRTGALRTLTTSRRALRWVSPSATWRRTTSSRLSVTLRPCHRHAHNRKNQPKAQTTDRQAIASACPRRFSLSTNATTTPPIGSTNAIA